MHRHTLFSSRCLPDRLETTVGLITTGSDGARNRIQRTRLERRFVVEVYGWGTLNPHLVIGMASNVGHVATDPELFFIFRFGWARSASSRKLGDTSIYVRCSLHIRIVHHVRPCIQVPHGSQDFFRASLVSLELTQMLHRNTAILEVSFHIASEGSEGSQQEVCTSKLKSTRESRWRLLACLSQRMNSCVTQLHSQGHLIVHQRTQSNFRKSTGSEGCLLRLRQGNQAGPSGEFIIGWDGRKVKQFVNRKTVIGSEAVAIFAATVEQMLMGSDSVWRWCGDYSCGVSGRPIRLDTTASRLSRVHAVLQLLLLHGVERSHVHAVLAQTKTRREASHSHWTSRQDGWLL
mmetsp:Transcript_11344/g.16619  ORF Transcript_11344/g.16619 Transcript_11344/m.16619 type:complete len:347 (-) Transcript_11344:457-1497(-)